MIFNILDFLLVIQFKQLTELKSKRNFYDERKSCRSPTNIRQELFSTSKLKYRIFYKLI